MRRKIRLWAVFTIIMALCIPGATQAIAKTKKPPFHYKDQAAVLIYHHFAATGNGATITTQTFRSQLQGLKDNGYHFISMNDFMMFKLYGNDLPDNAVLITVDDGYESLYKIAYPILQEFGVEAATFVIVQSTDKPMMNGEHFEHLTWDQMREMKSNGMSFYSHTYGLHREVQTDAQGKKEPALTGRIYDPKNGTAETEEVYRDRVKTDLALADERLKKELGNKTNLLCFPYGKYNDETITMGKEADIRLFFTTKPGINESDGDVLVKRINAGSAGITAGQLLKKLRVYDAGKI